MGNLEHGHLLRKTGRSLVLSCLLSQRRNFLNYHLLPEIISLIGTCNLTVFASVLMSRYGHVSCAFRTTCHCQQQRSSMHTKARQIGLPGALSSTSSGLISIEERKPVTR